MPLHKTMMTYTTLWTIADIVEQKFISKKQKHDIMKTLRVTTVGTFVVAPLVFNWMRLIERLIPGKQMKNVLAKVIMEQLTFAPVSISVFYSANSLLEGKSMVEEIKKKGPITWRTGVMFWPFVQTINFGFVTPVYRPFVVAGGSFVWSLFLCYMEEDKKEEESEAIEETSIEKS